MSGNKFFACTDYFNPYSNFIKQMLLFFPFYIWPKRGSERGHLGQDHGASQWWNDIRIQGLWLHKEYTKFNRIRGSVIEKK